MDARPVRAGRPRSRSTYNRAVVTAAPLPASPVPGDIDRVYTAQQKRRAAVAVTTADERIVKLTRLEKMLVRRRDEIRRALWDDYRKPAPEVDLSEIYPVVSEIRFARRHLRRWMRPRRVATPLTLFGSRSSVVYEPKGVVLVISPWNFPVNLSLGPVVSAVAAGNCVMLKPSERTPHASACMKRILAEVFAEDEVAVIEGDVSVSRELLTRKFDHIFFTGGANAGRAVMRAAAEHLTPVTLELGGKSPAIVDAGADLEDAARKIALGKLFNSGQVCVSPDYVLVHESVRAALEEKLVAVIRSLQGREARGILVDDVHADRIHAMFEEAKRSGRVILAGETGVRSMDPVVVANVDPSSRLMQEEIFGPILPVVSFRDLDEALAVVEERERPLVLYLFTKSDDFVREVVMRTRAGGTAVNHTLVQFFQLNLPFGGVGESGIGKSHGFFGFETFSNARAIFEQRTRLSTFDLLVPPYTAVKRKLIELAVRWL